MDGIMTGNHSPDRSERTFRDPRPLPNTQGYSCPDKRESGVVDQPGLQV
jgi:hypothetical protein